MSLLYWTQVLPVLPVCYILYSLKARLIVLTAEIISGALLALKLNSAPLSFSSPSRSVNSLFASLNFVRGRNPNTHKKLWQSNDKWNRMENSRNALYFAKRKRESRLRRWLCSLYKGGVAAWSQLACIFYNIYC